MMNILEKFKPFSKLTEKNILLGVFLIALYFINFNLVNKYNVVKTGTWGVPPTPAEMVKMEGNYAKSPLRLYEQECKKIVPIVKPIGYLLTLLVLLTVFMKLDHRNNFGIKLKYFGSTLTLRIPFLS